MSTGKGPSGNDVGDLRERLGLGVPKKAATTETANKGKVTGRRLEPGTGAGSTPSPIAAQSAQQTTAVGAEAEAAQVPATSTAASSTPSLDPSLSPFGSFAAGVSQPTNTTGASQAPAFGGNINLLLADGDEELSGVGGSLGKKTKRTAILIAVLTLILGLAAGYPLGTGKFQRQMVNQKIDDSLMVLGKVEPIVNQLAPILSDLKNTKSDRVDPELAQRLNTIKFELSYDDVITRNPILGPLLTNHLMKFVVQANTFRDMGYKHASLTLKEHKSFLEQISNSSEVLKDKSDVFIHYAPRPSPTAPPPKGSVVVPTGEATQRGRSFILPVKTLTGEEKEADVEHLIQLDKSQLIDAQGPNVMQLYVDRVKDLQVLGRDMEGYMTTLLTLLKKEAEKDHIFAF